MKVDVENRPQHTRSWAHDDWLLLLLLLFIDGKIPRQGVF